MLLMMHKIKKRLVKQKMLVMDLEMPLAMPQNLVYEKVLALVLWDK
jgi:hypothetical protein